VRKHVGVCQKQDNPKLTWASECLQNPPPKTVKLKAFGTLRSR